MIKKEYEEIYYGFVENYKHIHLNPWHEISENQLNDIYQSIINHMDIDDEYSFKYLMDFIIKRLSGSSDAHTLYSSNDIMPINFKIIGDKVLVNYPEYLRGSNLESINGINIKKILEELEEVITYGTPGKKRFELEKALFNRMDLYGLPSLKNSKELKYLIAKNDGTSIIKEFPKNKKFKPDELFDYNLYYFGIPGKYTIKDNCLIYNHSSVNKAFQEQLITSITNLRKEDLSQVDTIIVDLRGNQGGNSKLNEPLMNFIKDNKDKKLITLTDYRVFSSGRYALVDLINLGSTTVGEEISTPINCFGNNNWFTIKDHKFAVSNCYFNLIIGVNFSSKEDYDKHITSKILQPIIYKPDISVEETVDDYLDKNDVILNTALALSIVKKR